MDQLINPRGHAGITSLSSMKGTHPARTSSCESRVLLGCSESWGVATIYFSSLPTSTGRVRATGFSTVNNIIYMNQNLAPLRGAVSSDLQYSLFSTLSTALEQIAGLFGDSYESDILDTMFPGLENQRDILPAFQGLINEERGLTPGFLDSYASCIDKKFQPRVHNGYIELRVEPQDWKSVNADRFVVAQLRIYKEWWYDGREWSSSSRNLFTAL
jgi:hypothetical protein